MAETNPDSKPDLNAVQNEWGEKRDDNFGYASEEERKASRGLEDWEMVEHMSEPELNISKWFKTVVGAIVLGIVTFVVLAYGVYFFLKHFGFHFFSGLSGS